MPKGFLPNSDNGLLRWSLNIRAKLLAEPGAFGVPAELVQSFSDAVDAFEAAMRASLPQNRSVVSTSGKNAAREPVRTQARTISSIIQVQPGLTNEDRINLGLNVRARWTQIQAPTEAPFLNVLPLSGNRVQVTLSSGGIGRRGKPNGVSAAAVFSNTGETNSDGTRNWRYEGARGKTRMIIQLDPSLPAGKQVLITAQWLNPRSQSGPMALPASTCLLGGTIIAPQLQRRAA